MKSIVNRYIDSFIICFAIIGMIFSHAIMSFSMVFMAIRFLFLDKSILKTYSKDLLIAIFSFFALILIGNIWSDNLYDALKQTEKSLPFLIVPLYLLSLPLQSTKNIKLYAHIYILSLLTAVGIGFFNIITIENPDMRTVMPFCSHIRFALHLTLAISFIILYCVRNKSKLQTPQILVLLFIALLFEFYMLITSSLTGVIISLFIVLIVLPLYFLFTKRNKKLLIGLLVGLMSLILLITSCFLYYVNDYFEPKQGEKKENLVIENGNYIFEDVDYAQMQEGVKKYLNESEDAVCKSREGEYLYVDIAIRYLNSKGYEKNLNGWSKLSQNDLENIKNGIPNYVYAEKIPLKARLYSTFYEIEAFNKEGKVKGSSLIQKFELWKHSLTVIKQNFLIGVGTGDVPRELKKQLQENSSSLAETNMRPHNQYFSIVFSYGILGLLIWFVFLFYPMFRQSLNTNPYYLVFLIIMLISFVSEDTLDNQAGIMMFCCWNYFFLSKQLQQQ